MKYNAIIMVLALWISNANADHPCVNDKTKQLLIRLAPLERDVKSKKEEWDIA